VAVLLAELGVIRTHSRPHVSNDNPHSDAAFKTLKYCPAFSERFGSIEDARAFCRPRSPCSTSIGLTPGSRRISIGLIVGRARDGHRLNDRS